jgi:formate hydrogenlyase transcriptional activator
MEVAQDCRRVADRRRFEDALIRAARSLTSTLDVDRVCDATLAAIEDAFDATCSWIVLHDPATHSLCSRRLRGPGCGAFAGVRLPVTTGLIGLTFSTRTLLFVPDVRQEHRWFDVERVHASGLRSVLMLPLVHNDHCFGLVGLDSPRFTAEHPPNERDIDRLEAFAAQVGIALSNATLFARIEADRVRLQQLLSERSLMKEHVDQLHSHIKQAGGVPPLVGRSPALKEVLRHAEMVASADTTVLVLGETGTGKELVARMIHEHSPRSRGAFIAVNCAALPEALVESELFGHERGAFTGAIASKPGKFELAHRGTLFLDEIGDLPADAQAKLLRVLQDGQVERVGTTHKRDINVRVVAATNRDLNQEIQDGRFRADLYYRLSVFPITIPPLRARPEDIVPLAELFLTHCARRLRKPLDRFAPDALTALTAYGWPGNVRELQNVVERSAILSDGPEVTSAAVVLAPSPQAPAPNIHLVSAAATASTRPDSISVVRSLAAAEREAIVAALTACAWRISGPEGAALVLGLKSTTLHAKMRKLGISRPRASGSSGSPAYRRA